MAFEPQIDFALLERLLEPTERARQQLNALEIPPMLADWLRSFTEARGSHMSTRIEGNPLSEEEVRAAFARPERGTDRAEIENRNYRDAVRFARQYADDPSADIDGGFIHALHFQIVRDVDAYGSAGRYRFEQNVVRDDGRVIYTPPPPGEVSRLMDDLVEWLRASRARKMHPLILAAVAHHEQIHVHPFDDGNGRTARALTAYFLARGGWRLRDFASVEHVFGGDVEDYYAQLRLFGDRYPGQHPDATHWITWFLAGWAAEIGVQTITAQTWLETREDISDFVEEGLSPRLADGVAFVALRSTFSSSEYRDALDVSSATAVADLKWLAEQGFVRREGRGPATRYLSLYRPMEEAGAEIRQNLRKEIFDWVGLE